MPTMDSCAGYDISCSVATRRYCARFRSLLRASGVQPLFLPARSPNLHAHAERFVPTIKSECLSKVVPLGEAHLRAILREYIAQYRESQPPTAGNVIPFLVALQGQR